MRNVFLLCCITVLSAFYLYPDTTSAQTFVTPANTPELALTPRLPSAHTEVTVSLVGGTVGSTNTDIRWFIDDVEKTESRKNRSITLTTAEVGGTTVVRSVITYANGTTQQVQKAIHPIRLDLIISPDTYTPSFYNGRPLPTSGSVVRAKVLLFGSTKLNEANYYYAWKVNNKTNNTTHGSTLSFIPGFETESIVSVTVFDTNSKPIAEKSVAIPVVKPQLYFYERNPLRGVLPIAFTDENYFVGDELTLHVEPYFIDSRTDRLETEWEINNENVTQTNNPFELTIQKTQNSGKATIGFEIFNPEQLLQNAKKSITFKF